MSPHGIGPRIDHSCPSCGATEGIRSLATPGATSTRTWTCDGCGTSWATTYTRRPRPSASVAVTNLGVMTRELWRLRWVVKQVVALADQESTLNDEQLRSRLRALAELSGG